MYLRIDMNTYHIGFFAWDNSVPEYISFAPSPEVATANFWDWLRSSDFPVSTDMGCPILYVMTREEMSA